MIDPVKTERQMKLRQIEIIAELIGRDNRQLTSDDFDILIELEVPELMDVRFRIEQTESSQVS